MHASHYYEIGSGHELCQDYAASSDESETKSPYIIVSDGCSGAPDTDLGSRILTRQGIKLIHQFDLIDYPLNVLDHATITARTMNLDLNALLATFLVGKVDHKYFSYFIIGDGVFFEINKDGTLSLTIVSYKSNAPNYLIYQISTSTKNDYIQNHSLARTIRKVVIDPNDQIVSDCTTEDSLGRWITDIVDISNDKVVGFLSDGACSFYSKNVNQNISFNDVFFIRELLKFKHYPGNFVVRRMFAMKTNFVTKDWVHDDDLAMAAIYCGE